MLLSQGSIKGKHGAIYPLLQNLINRKRKGLFYKTACSISASAAPYTHALRSSSHPDASKRTKSSSAFYRPHRIWPPRRSAAAAAAAAAAMGLEMEEMAASIGVSVPVLRFLLCFAATIPTGLLWRAVPGATGRHLYAGLTGAALSYLSFGATSNLLFVAPMALGYLAMLLFRRHAGLITFLGAFGFLIAW